MKKFDLTTIYNEKRPLSWSAISSFEWNPLQWYEKYVLGEKMVMTPELEFGSMVDKKIQEDPKYLPHVVRYPILQHKMFGTFDSIPLIGYADAYRPYYRPMDVKDAREDFKPAIRDYKTGRKAWDQKRADETGQLTLYTFFLYMMEKIKPEDVELYIDWLPTHYEDNKICFIEKDHRKLKPKTFRTKRSMRDVIKFGERINRTWIAMEQYAGRDHAPRHVPVKRPLSRLLK